jgi:hypothetical protein
MKRELLGLYLIGVVVSGVALAHGGGEHVMGTVKSIEPSSLTVETKDKEVVFHLDQQTSFEKSGSKVTAAELKPGERVVVHAMKHGEMLHAKVVRFGKVAKGGNLGRTRRSRMRA